MRSPQRVATVADSSATRRTAAADALYGLRRRSRRELDHPGGDSGRGARQRGAGVLVPAGVRRAKRGKARQAADLPDARSGQGAMLFGVLFNTSPGGAMSAPVLKIPPPSVAVLALMLTDVVSVALTVL
jgi:hypothetical protein